MQPPRDILVIGYGNPLRGDDGAGPKVVEQLADISHGKFDTLVVHQPTPDLAEVVARRELVIFVDAAVGCQQLRVEALPPAQTGGDLGHQCGPREILALAHVLYQASPAAWLVGIPAEAFALGAAFSPITRQALPQAARAVLDLVDAKVLNR